MLCGATVLATACVSPPDRPAHSSYECMVAVRNTVPAGLQDKRAHCVASARISQRCSVTEAYLAGAGKEIRDLFTGGDAEWADWRADRVGIACAKHAASAELITSCCEQHGY